MSSPEEREGAIAWMARNPVAANLLMAVLMVGGIIVGLRVKQEVFPEFELDLVRIEVPYPGASPAEVESGIVLAIEEEIRGLDGIKKIDSVAAEGMGVVVAELLLGADNARAASDIKNAVDRIRSFPQDAERPVVSLVANRRQVISLVLYGDTDEETLKGLAEKARLELLQEPGVTLIELSGVREREISVEVSQANLRAYGLTLQQVAEVISRASVELPGGAVKTRGGEILLRTAERRNLGAEFSELVLLTTASGTQVRVGDVATVLDGFADNDQADFYNGQPAVMVNVYRVGDQTPIAISDTVKAYHQRLLGELPAGVAAATINDSSQIYRDRIALLLRNAYMGLFLVLVALSLFLEIRLAFWVTMGIPISFLGSLLLMPSMNVSINMISLFAFIVTLGMVVDDAIVVGENVFEARQRGLGPMEAAIHGCREVGIPVVFSVTTTMAAFSPLLFVPGVSGKFFGVIPIIVILVLFISLIESLFILPAHLAHISDRPPGAVRRAVLRVQGHVTRALLWFTTRVYRPQLRFALDNRYLVLAVALAIFLAAVGYIVGGRIDFTFMPKVESDRVAVNATLPFGAAIEETRAIQLELLRTAREVIDEHGGDAIIEGVYTGLGSHAGGTGPRAGPAAVQGNLTNVQIYLVPSDKREVNAVQLTRAWREKTQHLIGLEKISFSYSTGPSDAPALDVQLRHEKIEVLEAAAVELAESLRGFQGLRDIDDGFSSGKPQLDFQLKPAAQSLGLTAAELGRQVRSAFYGAEALRQQRGRDEVRVMVRLPKPERETELTIEDLLVRTPAGGEIPLAQAASITRGRSYTAINRTDGRRVVDVTADAVIGVASIPKIKLDLETKVLPELARRHPGLTFSFEGENRRQAETMDALQQGFIIALIVIYALLAVPFKSYAQPLVVMSAIPFGMVGALLGHLVMGYGLSMISMFGIVALGGVVVNDSLVLVDTTNRARREDRLSAYQAVLYAAQRRLRPIFLTSITTFLGLAPMILETSVQARFLIPMAISLGFGVMFSTFIILLLVPALYLIIEDAKELLGMRALPADELERSASELGASP